VWGLQVERQIARIREFSVFAFTPTTEPGGIPRFGHLHGLRELRTGRRLEVLPYWWPAASPWTGAATRSARTARWALRRAST
jgi:hypothetical protein